VPAGVVVLLEDRKIKPAVQKMRATQSGNAGTNDRKTGHADERVEGR
jgi:hypothetical protein